MTGVIGATTTDTFNCNVTDASNYVKSVTVTDAGAIVIVAQNIPQLGTNNTLKLTPTTDAAGATAFTSSDYDGTNPVRAWVCSAGDAAGNNPIEDDYLPANCR